MKTMICLILDRSGSMGGRETDVIGGVNRFLADQKKLPDPASVALVRFDTGAIERFREMQDLAGCAELDANDFQPRGGTPLLDAIGQTLTKLDEDWKVVKPDAAIVVVVTDGYENSSREFTKGRIKDMIESREKSGKWSFIYLGANVDAFAEGGAMGFAAHNTASYDSTARGTHALYASVSASVSAKRMSHDLNAGALGGKIEEDGTLTKANPAPSAAAGPSNPPAANAAPVWKEPGQTWQPPQ